MRNTVLFGDALEQLAKIPDESVHCCVTSPPYWGLRDYGTATWEGGDPNCDHGVERWDGPKQTQGAQSGHSARRNRLDRATCRCGAVRVDNQLGLEPTPAEYVDRLVRVFREVRRVLHPSGTLWLNLGDSYVTRGGRGEERMIELGSPSPRAKQTPGARGQAPGTKVWARAKTKDLVGIPWMVAFALRDDGWWLRSDIIWHKNNVMPESVRDRPTNCHEHVFLLAKSERYFYDQDAIRKETANYTRKGGTAAYTADGATTHGIGSVTLHQMSLQGRNKRDVWTINPVPYKGAHFAVFPPTLPEICIKAGTSEKGACPECGAPWRRVTKRGDIPEMERPRETNTRDGGLTPENNMDRTGLSHRKYNEWLQAHPPETVGWEPTCECHADPAPCVVFDPFAGSGTTLAVAASLNRDFIGIELNPDYKPLIDERVQPEIEARGQREAFDLMGELE